MQQLKMRGADTNHVNKITGLTPLHTAIKAKLESKVIKYLLSIGANPHIEDTEGFDCCDKAQDIERYSKVKEFKKYAC